MSSNVNVAWFRRRNEHGAAALAADDETYHPNNGRGATLKDNAGARSASQASLRSYKILTRLRCGVGC